MTQSTVAPAASPEAAHLAAEATLYRLAAVLLSYPLAETQQALEDGRLSATLAPAWQTLTGEAWPALPPSASLEALEVGYMATFIHGRRGKPRVPLVANAYEALLAGQTPGSYMLNVQAFYRHFDLQAAQGDEGHTDEPDHLATMLEFCTLLCHLESRADADGRDASPYRRARRDFIARHLAPLLHAVKASYADAADQGLDATLAHLIEVLPDWADRQRARLEAQAGPCPAPGSKAAAGAANQAMWD
ncbi:molecular chaperone TorD family protein [Halomonas piscis]|uniref:molecular chaperone TorD family protein n=1 Tax=Halomonas piscis TaxID=3031727 RepID=UPI0028A087FA|nr:molecular chaperone TorD family protein [Halomonas piscis]